MGLLRSKKKPFILAPGTSDYILGDQPSDLPPQAATNYHKKKDYENQLDELNKKNKKKNDIHSVPPAFNYENNTVPLNENSVLYSNRNHPNQKSQKPSLPPGREFVNQQQPYQQPYPPQQYPYPPQQYQQQPYPPQPYQQQPYPPQSYQQQPYQQYPQNPQYQQYQQYQQNQQQKQPIVNYYFMMPPEMANSVASQHIPPNIPPNIKQKTNNYSQSLPNSPTTSSSTNLNNPNNNNSNDLDKQNRRKFPRSSSSPTSNSLNDSQIPTLSRTETNNSRRSSPNRENIPIDHNNNNSNNNNSNNNNNNNNKFIESAIRGTNFRSNSSQSNITPSSSLTTDNLDQSSRRSSSDIYSRNSLADFTSSNNNNNNSQQNAYPEFNSNNIININNNNNNKSISKNKPKFNLISELSKMEPDNISIHNKSMVSYFEYISRGEQEISFSSLQQILIKKNNDLFEIGTLQNILDIFGTSNKGIIYLDGLKQFVDLCKFLNGCILSFLCHDADNSGGLDYSEFKQCLNSSNITYPESLIQDIFYNLPKQKDYLQLEEYINAVIFIRLNPIS